MTAFALDPSRSNLVAVGNVLPKAAYSDKIDPTLGYKPKLTDGNGDVVQAEDEDGRLIWTFDVAPEDEDKALPITVTIACPHMPVVKRFAPVTLKNPVLNVYARSDGKRANLGLAISCDGVVSQGQHTPSSTSTATSSSSTQAKSAA